MEEPGPSQVTQDLPNEDSNRTPSRVNSVREVSPSSSSTSSDVSLVENVANTPATIFPPFSPLRETVFVGLTKRQLTILVVFGFSEFFGAILYSNHGLWFPKEATRKGVSASEFGFAFGAFELAVLIFSPLFGILIRKDSVRPNVLFHLGVFTTGIGAVIFSLLGFVTDPTIFLISSIVIRFVEGIGEGAFITASFTIIAHNFPDAITSTFASMQTFFGLGIICGPVMGGALFDGLVGDGKPFTLTFGVLGGILVLTAVIGMFILPGIETHSHELEGRKSIRSGQILSILKIGSVRLAASSIVTAAVSIGFLSAILELHLRQFEIHPVLLGGIFIINGGLYAISAPLWGWLLEKYSKPKYFILLGTDLIIGGFLLIGPAKFIPLETSIMLTCIGLGLHGLGIGAVLVSSFNLSLKKAVKFGYEENIVTYGIVSSLWMAMFSIGSFIGPSAAGILFDNFGFKDSSWLVLGMQLLLFLVTILSIWNTRNENDAPRELFKSEEKPLLYSSSQPSFNIGDDVQNKKYGSTQP